MELDNHREETRIKANNEKWTEYRRRTKEKLPKKPLVKLLDKLEPGKAIELGPGSGIDTLYLLEKGWQVLGVDSASGTEEDIRSLISTKNEEALANFSFINQSFEKLELEKEEYDLLVGFNSVFFCSPEKFNDFFETLTGSIKPQGYLLINLLGKKDDWNKTGSRYKTFLEKEEILELLKGFEIDENTIKEREFDSKTTISKIPKHWHTFFICAKKK